jgi:hypothetical protein
VAGSGSLPSAVIDAANGKLLVVTVNGANSNKPSLFRCNLDGTSCSYTDLSAGQPPNSAVALSAVIDAPNGKLLVATEDVANGGKPSLFRCGIDGTSCSHADLAAGQAVNSGTAPSAVIDAANGKLYVATQNDANSGKPSVFRCNFDGTNCSHTDLSAGLGGGSGKHPSARIDAANGKLLVATTNGANLDAPGLFILGLW